MTISSLARDLGRLIRIYPWSAKDNDSIGEEKGETTWREAQGTGAFMCARPSQNAQ